MPPKRTRTTPTAQRDASDLVQLDCKFLIGDRVDDECFGPGTVIELPLESYPAGDERKGKIFIMYDDASLAPRSRWRTWGHFTVPERRAPARAAVTRNGNSGQQAQLPRTPPSVPQVEPEDTREPKKSKPNDITMIRCLTRDLIDGMKLELDKYATAVADVSISRADVQEFTDDVLTFWRTHKSELPMWARSARIVFAMSTNSASCERVFSLLANMFGDNQNSALGDLLQGSLMLRYNKREVG